MTEDSLAEFGRLLNPESNEEFRGTLEEMDLPYQGGSRREIRNGKQFERQTIYEVEFGDQELYFVVEEDGEFYEVLADEVEGVPDELEEAYVDGEVTTGVYVTEDRSMLDSSIEFRQR